MYKIDCFAYDAGNGCLAGVAKEELRRDRAQTCRIFLVCYKSLVKHRYNKSSSALCFACYPLSLGYVRNGNKTRGQESIWNEILSASKASQLREETRDICLCLQWEPEFLSLDV